MKKYNNYFKYYFLLVCIFVWTGLCFGQNQNSMRNVDELKDNIDIVVGYDIFWMKSNLNIYNAISSELNSGLSYNRQINKKNTSIIGFCLGWRICNEYAENRINEELLDRDNDFMINYMETVNRDKFLSIDYLFIEMPLSFNRNLIENFDIAIGVTPRFYFALNSEFNDSYLSINNLMEYRLSVYLKYHLNHKYAIALEYDNAINPVYKRYGIVQIDETISEYYSTFKSRNIGLKLLYKI